MVIQIGDNRIEIGENVGDVVETAIESVTEIVLGSQDMVTEVAVSFIETAGTTATSIVSVIAENPELLAVAADVVAGVATGGVSTIASGVSDALSGLFDSDGNEITTTPQTDSGMPDTALLLAGLVGVAVLARK